MHRYLVFDLDGTLAPVGRAASTKTTELLKTLENTGYVICICSGKPAYYLCGFARQLGLKNPILIGENGLVLQFGISLPPEKYYAFPVPKKQRKALAALKKEIENRLGDRVWFQPNSAALTPFLTTEKDFSEVENILKSSKVPPDSLRIYRQADCFDILPGNISKRDGLMLLSEKTGAHPSDFIAVGDGINDLPMFEYADLSFGIGSKIGEKTSRRFENIEDALSYILKNKL